MGRKKVLVLTHNLPALIGQGAAMRLGNIVETLTQKNDVTLVCVSPDRSVDKAMLEDHWTSKCVRSFYLNVAEQIDPLHRKQRRAVTRLLNIKPNLSSSWPLDEIVVRLNEFRGEHYDQVLIVRIRLMPIWRAMVAQLGIRADYKVLDLDDIESRSHARQIQVLGPRHLGRVGFLLEWLECGKLALEEAKAFKEMDKVLLCSAEDKALLARRFEVEKIGVVPNTIRIPVPLASGESADTLRLLFVGTLRYPPNEDAVKWMVESILPEVKRRVDKHIVRLTVVGRAPTEWMRQMAASRVFELHANVPDVMPFYEACDVVLVPIRAGGGTRIKILEAFGYGRIVLSTTLGAEGIDVQHEKELLIADTAAEFADAIVTLIKYPDRRQRLVTNARRKVEESYSMATCEQAIDSIFG